MSNAARAGSPILERLAAGPISWGVCEVPGWGIQLPPDRVLSEMRSLGIVATEAGPDGYLGRRPGASCATCSSVNGLELVGGFLPVVLHDPARLDASLAKVARAPRRSSPSSAPRCSARPPSSTTTGRRASSLTRRAVGPPAGGAGPPRRGRRRSTASTHALHPHWRTVVERDADVRRVARGVRRSRICLDTGHLTLGGSDPLAIARGLADRIVHVHLKDVDTGVAERLRTGELDAGPGRAGRALPAARRRATVARRRGRRARSSSAGYARLVRARAGHRDLDAVPADGTGPDRRRPAEHRVPPDARPRRREAPRRKGGESTRSAPRPTLFRRSHPEGRRASMSEHEDDATSSGISRRGLVVKGGVLTAGAAVPRRAGRAPTALGAATDDQDQGRRRHPRRHRLVLVGVQEGRRPGAQVTSRPRGVSVTRSTRTTTSRSRSQASTPRSPRRST